MLLLLLLLQNPKKGDPNNVGLDTKADFPSEQQDKFQGYAWLGAIDPTLLDHQNCEMLLIAASTDVESAPPSLNALLHAVMWCTPTGPCRGCRAGTGCDKGPC